ncbi:hypothetical protein [Gloeobacter violaceus]|uniref:Gsl2172 protein n=1 Tax=Gloeobacter violaceus (strain ATCC 29082 / PCC 7421) TaxID=251221 RepID=Q7NIL1_GLOVI|nr:hypothetical protein [Gloeobacter violaceus]BAC90113.1 gsl2172 [Gloeobacter violaceus PCC 7421]
MLILNKASVDLCPIRRSRRSGIEVGLKFGDHLFYPCSNFAATEMREAIAFYRSCPGSSLIVSDEDGFQVWCNLPNLETVDAVGEKELSTVAA